MLPVCHKCSVMEHPSFQLLLISATAKAPSVLPRPGQRSFARCISPHLVAFLAFVPARGQMRARVSLLLRLTPGPLVTHASNGEKPDDLPDVGSIVR